ncbi:MAG: DUF402 domain-containing protein [Anaerolineae bacterium]
MIMFTVIKRNARSQFLLQYEGQLIEQGETWVCVEATLAVPQADVGLFRLQGGDRMTEWFYSDRYYNVFKVHDPADGRLKGWYCNITRPAEITADSVAADDLALDVVVNPQGALLVLDEDEFTDLQLSAEEQASAWAAVETIRQLVAAHQSPFDL